MAAAYLVTLPDSYIARVLEDGKDSIVVYAADAEQAKEIAKSAFKWDIDAPWASATVTELAVATDWATPQLWNFRIRIRTPAGAVLHNVTVQSSAADNTVDEIAALLVTALNATTINSAAYVSGTNVLTIAAVGDAIGDHFVELSAWPTTLNERDGFSASFFGSPTHGGVAAAALTVTLVGNVDATVPPVFYASMKSA